MHRQSMLPSPQQPAPLFRRLLAFGVDLLATVVIGHVAAAPINYLIPPDDLSSLVIGVLPGTTLGLFYFGYAPLLLGNTLGKWLFSLKIVGVDDQPITKAGWFVRLLASGLWPINSAMVLLSRARRHLGDRWENSIVIGTEPKRNLWLATAGALVFAVCSSQVATLALKVGIVRTGVWATVKQHLAEQEPGAVVPVFPATFQIVNDRAVFDAQIGARSRRVILVRVDNQWRVVASDLFDGTPERLQ